MDAPCLQFPNRALHKENTSTKRSKVIQDACTLNPEVNYPRLFDILISMLVAGLLHFLAMRTNFQTWPGWYLRMGIHWLAAASTKYLNKRREKPTAPEEHLVMLYITGPALGIVLKMLTQY
ncbi:hypothetical protein FH972_024961 [Carpinus fangiana]|uniref:Uncharacterized protein n=1 Tax=Carpinus fangiana TaxID=176857 RepID=A0A5N6KZZ3_9ROSI|nr:hypothetical protein FH972_024961 [Carpinus fangiana]